MKRQAMAICLDTIKFFEKEIKKEIKDIEKNTGQKIKDKRRMCILFPIVNYKTVDGKKEIYCSDTWIFEGFNPKKKKRKKCK